MAHGEDQVPFLFCLLRFLYSPIQQAIGDLSGCALCQIIMFFCFIGVNTGIQDDQCDTFRNFRDVGKAAREFTFRRSINAASGGIMIIRISISVSQTAE